jgi:hypothetical protein
LVQPDPAFVAQARDAKARGLVLDLDGGVIKCYPPKSNQREWRILYRADRRREATTVDDPTALYNKLLEIRQRVAALINPQASQPVTVMIDAYIEAQRAKVRGWSKRTCRDRRLDLAKLRVLGDEAKLICADLGRGHFQAALNECGTGKRAAFVHKQMLAMARWARKKGYLLPGQVTALEDVEWEAPEGWQEPPSRRQQARRSGTSGAAVNRGEVPTHAQVSDWGRAALEHYLQGRGLIETDAVTGLRLGELLALTADPEVASRGEGNLVDCESWELQVRVQLSDAPRTTKLPKADKIRDVVVPRVDRVPTGFDIREWLRRRCLQALDEQLNGKNANALIFPTPVDRGYWWQSNLYDHVLRPANADLGWPVTTITDKNGRTRQMMRFTMHSLRDRYACTAVDSWKYPEPVLLEQGAWEDAVTVRRFYLGTTDDTHDHARALIA